MIVPFTDAPGSGSRVSEDVEEVAVEITDGGFDSGYSVPVDLTVTDLRYFTIPATKPSISSSLLTTVDQHIRNRSLSII